MDFLILDKRELKVLFDRVYKDEMQTVLEYVVDVFSQDDLKKLPEFVANKTKRYHATKKQYTSLFITLFEDPNFTAKLYAKLTKSDTSRYLYENLIWQKSEISTGEFTQKFNIKLNKGRAIHYGWSETALDDDLSLVSRRIYYTYREAHSQSDSLGINYKIRQILKLAYPKPVDYNLLPKEGSEVTDFTYNNENGVLQFIQTIKEMLENNLVEFGKTNEKPLVKTLNILKSSTSMDEFYYEKKLDTLAVDMLTRSFSYYYYVLKSFKNSELESLKDFVKLQFEDRFRFTISRIFASHLKKVKFGSYSDEQKELFDIGEDIIHDMPKDSWVDFDNVISYCTYREYRFDFESSWKSNDYNLDCDIVDGKGNKQTDTLYAKQYYDAIVFEPILKALFFYLGALGLVELKYNKPATKYIISAKDKPYISVWDSLRYIKLTPLGKYVFGLSKSYTAKKIIKKESKLKFDEYKPIIFVDKHNTIMLAKLEPFAEKHDDNRYILSYNKIFKDCKNYKALELKIDNFYKNIEPNPPKVFIEFFDEIKNRSNMLKRDLKQVVIELKNDKKLLNLFMTNKKLQEIVIKAQGYRIIVLKENLPKLTKIVKDNGFFIDF